MNSKEEFTIQMKTKVAEIEEILKRYLPEAEGYQKVIMEAMEYSLMAGGKRLRPMLVRETCRLFGEEPEILKPFMAALESTAEAERRHTLYTGKIWESWQEMHF